MKKILFLDIELTNHCNARCLICPRDKLERPMGHMSHSVFETLIDRIRDSDISKIIFSGFGEPLLHPNLPEYVHLLRTQLNPDIEIRVNTNASLLTSTLSRKLIDAGLDVLSVSYNGPDPDAYEKTMKGMSYSRLQENIRAFHEERGRKRKPLLSLQSSMAEDKAHRKTVRRVASGLGFEKLSFYSYNNRGGHLERMEESPVIPLEERFCAQFLFAAWDGTLYPCSHDIKGSLPLGHVDTHAFRAIKKKDFPLCRHCTICGAQELESHDLRKNRFLRILKRLAG